MLEWDSGPASRTREMAKEPCPSCGGKLVPIAYGLPGEELMEAAQRGEVAMGGCVVTGDDPVWQCRECRCRFYTDGRAAPSSS